MKTGSECIQNQYTWNKVQNTMDNDIDRVELVMVKSIAK